MSPPADALRNIMCFEFAAPAVQGISLWPRLWPADEEWREEMIRTALRNTDKRRYMSAKLGRNDPCWYGSGKKYKKCHIDRKYQEVVRPSEIDEHFRKRSETGNCLHVGATGGSICGQPAIGSHTVVRKMLKQIARNDHVYYQHATIQYLEKTQASCQSS